MKKMYTKEQLFKIVKKLYEDDGKIAFGQQNDGGRALPSQMIEKFYNATGKYPAVFGVDLACYGLQIPFAGQKLREKAIDELVEFANAGGIVTASSHWANPTGNDGGDLCRGHLGREEAWEELLTEGSELNTIWKAELLQDARFLKALGDRGVPVLWRPLHEQNGGWFWFCITQDGYTLPAKYMERAWRYVYDLYENKLGLTNLIWVFSPNISNSPVTHAMYCYPGDDVVDIVGYDWYTGGNYEVDGEGKTHDRLMKTGKPLAITEFGPTGSVLAPHDKEQTEDGFWNGRDMLALLERLIADGRKTAFVMTWTWHWSIISWKYAKEFMDNKMIVDRDALGIMFDELAEKE